jgi:hypothetical protein
VLEFKADVEMILNRSFTSACDDDDVLNTGVQHLLNAVLNERLVHERQHLFRLRLRCG